MESQAGMGLLLSVCLPTADGFMAEKRFSCRYTLLFPCVHCASAFVSRVSKYYSVFCAIDVAPAPYVGDRLCAVLGHVATCHRFTFLVFDFAGVCFGRCDANVSVRPRGQEKFGTKAEVKNVNRDEQCDLGGHGICNHFSKVEIGNAARSTGPRWPIGAATGCSRCTATRSPPLRHPRSGRGDDTSWRKGLYVLERAAAHLCEHTRG
jgi:hypothetical protein